MNKISSMLLGVCCLLFATNVFAGFNEKSYELPGHGVLLMNVPNTWADQIRQPPGGLPPTIQLSQISGEDFVILVTPIWKTPNAPANYGSAEGIKQMVEGAALNASSQAVETNIVVKEVSGSNVGFYFTATDKAPKPGEYEFLCQGVVGVNEIMVTFTILTHSSDSPAIEQAMKMVSSLQHSR